MDQSTLTVSFVQGKSNTYPPEKGNRIIFEPMHRVDIKLRLRASSCEEAALSKKRLAL